MAKKPARQNKAPTTARKRQRAKRMPGADRKAMIIDEAVRFFAQHGFSGSTRDLADIVGVYTLFAFTTANGLPTASQQALHRRAGGLERCGDHVPGFIDVEIFRAPALDVVKIAGSLNVPGSGRRGLLRRCGPRLCRLATSPAPCSAFCTQV